jgi:S-(hydroxymethyl)glutathione dehydrogenase/alcohol dehydrogenase
VRAAIAEKGGGGKFVIRDDVVLADPIGAEILVDVKGSGLCHSDLIGAEEETFGAPAVLGHEVGGVVAAVGPNVTDFEVGDHVVACLLGFCGKCHRCAAGEKYLCVNFPFGTQREPGEPPRITLDGVPLAQGFDIGGFAEQALIHSNNAVRIDQSVPLNRACLLGCGAATGVGAAVNSAPVRFGDTVAVIGCGGVGLHVVQGARLAGARRVIAVDVNPDKLELAKRFGATDVVEASAVDPVQAVVELSGGGVDYTFEVVGRRETADQAYAMLSVGGTALLVGHQPPGTVVNLDVGQAQYRRVSAKPVAMGSTNFRVDIPLYADLYMQGRLLLDELVSDTISLDDVNDAYSALVGGEIARAVISFD